MAGASCTRQPRTSYVLAGLPPVRAVQHAASVTAGTIPYLDARTWVIGLRDGGALVPDPRGSRILRLDSTLAFAGTTLDTVAVKLPGFTINCLRPYTADSSILLTPNSPDAGRIAPLDDPVWKLRVLDERGQVARSAALPRSFWPSCFQLGVEPRAAGLIYVPTRFARDSGGAQMDSMPILRLDVADGRVDTLNWLHVETYAAPSVEWFGAYGQEYIESVYLPARRADEWGITSDGALAVLRWRDYRIDWLFADGTRRTTRNIPWTWRRLTSRDKQHVVDSIAPTTARAQAEATREMWEDGRGVFIMMSKPAPASELPDSLPPFVGDRGYVRTDDEGNIWMRSMPTTPVGPGTLYDVIDRTGHMIDRVLFAPGRILVGVAGGNAYLAVGVIGTRHLERVVVKPLRRQRRNR